MSIKKGLIHTFNLAACTIGGAMVTASSAALLMSTLPHGGDAGFGTALLLLNGALLLGVGYGRVFGGKPDTSSSNQNQNEGPAPR